LEVGVEFVPGFFEDVLVDHFEGEFEGDHETDDDEKAENQEDFHGQAQGNEIDEHEPAEAGLFPRAWIIGFSREHPVSPAHKE
jgi:hypothetical protein